MKRRHFLSWFSFSAILSVFPALLSACGKSGSSSTGNTSSAGAPSANQRPDGFINAGQLSDLDNSGMLSFSTQDGQSIAVFRDQKDSETLYAVDTVCTHQNCKVNWMDADQTFVCPCHGSKFAPKGQVLSGPAEQPLKQYAVKVEAGAILVRTS